MKLHIGNLPTSVTEKELTDLFTPIATPTSVEIVKDRDGVSKGFGFAVFGTDTEARAIISGVDGKEVGGKTLKLGEARPRRTDARA